MDSMLLGEAFYVLSGCVSSPDLFKWFHFSSPGHPGILPSGAVQGWAKLEDQSGPI